MAQKMNTDEIKASHLCRSNLPSLVESCDNSFSRLTFWYLFSRAFFGIALAPLVGRKVLGSPHLPATSPPSSLLVVKHRTWTDLAALACELSCPLHFITPFSKTASPYYARPFLSGLNIAHADSFCDTAASLRVRMILEKGGTVAVSLPTVDESEMAQVSTWLGRTAYESLCRVVPVNIISSPGSSPLLRRRIVIKAGTPVSTTGYISGLSQRDKYQSLGTMILTALPH
jgi:hypothetical protein